MISSHLLVIGGGFAGIAAAAALRARGASVTLLDERRVLGGRARSDELNEVTIDTGAQLIVTSFTRTLRLLTRHSAPDETSAGASGSTAHGGALRRTAGRDAYVRDGVRYPLQFGSVRSLLGFGGLGALEKIKLGRHLLPLIALHRGQLDADALRLPASLDGESASAFVSSHVGQRAADVLVEPPLNGFYAVRGSEASLGFFLTLARYGSESDVLAAVGGWSRALAAALRGAAFEPETRVTALELAAAGGVVVRSEDGREWRADGVVIATGPRTAHALLAPLVAAGDQLLGWLASVKLRPTWTLALAIDVALERDVFGVFHDVHRARAVSACAVHGAKMAAPPHDRDVVLAWPTPDVASRMRESASEHIVSAMLPEVEYLIPAVRGHVTRARVYRFDEGTPLAHPGFAADRTRARALAVALPLPIALAGDYLATPIIEGAVASGEGAAHTLAERLTRR